jgi:hypothetical protein
MNEPEHRIETRRWLRYAEQDLRAVEASLLMADFSPDVCAGSRSRRRRRR